MYGLHIYSPVCSTAMLVSDSQSWISSVAEIVRLLKVLHYLSLKQGNYQHPKERRWVSRQSHCDEGMVLAIAPGPAQRGRCCSGQSDLGLLSSLRLILRLVGMICMSRSRNLCQSYSMSLACRARCLAAAWHPIYVSLCGPSHPRHKPTNVMGRHHFRRPHTASRSPSHQPRSSPASLEARRLGLVTRYVAKPLPRAAC